MTTTEELADKRKRRAGHVARPSALTTLDRFLAGAPIHYSAFGGDLLTARYCTDDAAPYLEIRDALTGKLRRAPIMSRGQAGAFYAGLEADNALLPALKPVTGR